MKFDRNESLFFPYFTGSLIGGFGFVDGLGEGVALARVKVLDTKKYAWTLKKICGFTLSEGLERTKPHLPGTPPGES